MSTILVLGGGVIGLSVAMMLRYSFHLEAEAECVEAAVASVLDAGHRTRDLAKRGQAAIGTAEMGGDVVAAMRERVTAAREPDLVKREKHG